MHEPGLPSSDSIKLGKKLDGVGFDTSVQRVEEVRGNDDCTLETSADEIAAASRQRFTADRDDLASSTVFIVTMPTPSTTRIAPT